MLAAPLDALRMEMAPGGTVAITGAIVSKIRAACDAMRRVEQDEALAAASEARLAVAHVLPMLRLAVHEDANEEYGLAAAASELISYLSGTGEHTSTFAVGEAKLQLRCQPQGALTGTRIWRASRLAVWACEVGWGGINVAGCRICELGCGTAAVGLACASLGASEVVLTDIDAAALSLAERNASLNGLINTRTAWLDIDAPTAEQLIALNAGVAVDSAATPAAIMSHSPTLLSMAELSNETALSEKTCAAAGSSHSEASTCEASTTFDYIIASDIIYDFTSPERVASTIERLLAGQPHARALVVHDRNACRSERARRSVDEFASAASRSTSLVCINSEEFSAEHYSGNDGAKRQSERPLMMQLFAVPRSP